MSVTEDGRHPETLRTLLGSSFRYLYEAKFSTVLVGGVECTNNRADCDSVFVIANMIQLFTVKCFVATLTVKSTPDLRNVRPSARLVP